MTCMQLAGDLWNIDVSSPATKLQPKLDNFMVNISVIKWSSDLMRQSNSQKFEKVLFEQNISQDLNNRLLTIIEKPEERMRKPINNLHFYHSRLQQPSQLQSLGEKRTLEPIKWLSLTHSPICTDCVHTYWIRSWIFLKTCGTKNRETGGERDFVRLAEFKLRFRTAGCWQ